MEEEIFRLQPWDPRVRLVAEAVIAEIQAGVPGVEVLFMGDAALGLPGGNEIELYMLCAEEDVAAQLKKLEPVLGAPQALRSGFAAWERQVDDFTVEIYLADPATPRIVKQQKIFTVLDAHPALLEQYRKLKKASDGKPYDVYEQLRKTFLDKYVLSVR